MADKKISQLASAVLPLAGTELVPVVQSGATVKVSAASLGAAAEYTPAGTGAVVSTVQAKLRESVSVKDFGAVGDGVTDDTAAIQAAINAAYNVNFGDASSNYKLNGTVTLRTWQRITANGASITQTAIRTQIFDASAKNNIEISGLSFVGVGSDFNNSAGSRADGVYTGGSNRLVIRDCTFTNCSHSALTAVASTDIQFLNNTVIGMGSPTLTPVTSGGCVGVVIDVGCNGAIIDGNTITQTSIGVQTGDSCLNVRVTNNYIYSIIGQHGFYGGGAQTNLVISNNTIKDTSLIGIKVQQYDAAAANTRNVTITGNAIYTTGSGGDGISLLSTTASPTYLIFNVTVSGNTVFSSGQDGIFIKNVKYGVVANNVVNGASREGISHSANTAVQIRGNTIYSAGNSGIREILATIHCSIVGNTVIDPAANATAGQRFGIYITTGSEMLVSDNVVVDTQAKMQYGFFIEGGTQTTFTLRNNYTAGAWAQGLRTVVGTAFRYYGGNVMTGTGGDTTGTTNVNQRGDLRVFYSTAVPATGSWLVGDYVKNSAPAVGSPKGWYCTVAGTPGTWVSEGNL